LLLEKGADIHQTSPFNRFYDVTTNCDVPPIEAACKFNRPKIVLILLKQYISTDANEQLVRYSIRSIGLTVEKLLVYIYLVTMRYKSSFVFHCLYVYFSVTVLINLYTDLTLPTVSIYVPPV
jgi:hypothetical protein